MDEYVDDYGLGSINLDVHPLENALILTGLDLKKM